MQNFVELMKRLIEVQNDERQRSPELVADDKRLMDGLERRILEGKPLQEATLRQHGQGA